MALRVAEGVPDALVVDPDRGIYVDMQGVMEVRYMEHDEIIDKEDMFDFQEREPEIPEDFCHKDRYSGEQAIFWCHACGCDLKSVIPLRDHVKGAKHIRKAVEKKRQTLGVPAQPPNAPRLKEKKPKRGPVDVNIRLRDLVKETSEPVVGLAFITEYLHPTERREFPMYTCTLEGCKSAWGNSDDIFNHIVKHKHQKNFLLVSSNNDPRIISLTKNEVLARAVEFADENPPYSSDIETVVDLNQYLELRSRPTDWTEKKAKAGIVGTINANYVQLGTRPTAAVPSRSLQPSQRPDSLFDEAAWAGWQPPTREEECSSCLTLIRKNLVNAATVVNRFTGESGSALYEDCMFAIDSIRNIITISAPGYKGVTALEEEVRNMLDVAKVQLQALENRVKEHMAGGGQHNSVGLKPGSVSSQPLPPSLVLIAASSSSSLSTADPKADPFSKGQARHEARKSATAAFEAKLKTFLEAELLNYSSQVPVGEKDHLIIKLQEKLVPVEVGNFGKKNLTWDQFVFGRKNEIRVSQFVKQYIDKKFS